MNNLIKLALLSAFATASFSATAAPVTTTLSQTVTWNATAVKKSDVDFNVFANSDSLQFKYDPLNARFTNLSSSLTVQAAGKPGATAYSIKANLVRNKLSNVMGPTHGSLSVVAKMGATEVPMDASKQIEMLKGSDKGVTNAVNGLQGMDLSQEGLLSSVGKPTSKFHQGTVNVDFNIVSGSSTGTGADDLTLGDATKGLDQLADGSYEGVVEMAFVASWTVGATDPVVPPKN